MVQEQKTVTALFSAMDEAVAALIKQLYAFQDEEINRVPFKGSWTAAQVAEHIRKSVTSITQALDMQGKIIYRSPDERIDELKKTFLDFTVKFKSPGFIVPAEGNYNKDALLSSLQQSFEKLKEKSSQVYLTDAITHPAFDEITKLELLHFVLYHTQRHLHQTKEIYKKLHHH